MWSQSSERVVGFLYYSVKEERTEEWAVINQQSHFGSGWRVYTLNMSTTFFVLLMMQSASKLMVCWSVGLL